MATRQNLSSSFVLTHFDDTWTLKGQRKHLAIYYRLLAILICVRASLSGASCNNECRLQCGMARLNALNGSVQYCVEMPQEDYRN